VRQDLPAERLERLLLFGREAFHQPLLHPAHRGRDVAQQGRTRGSQEDDLRRRNRDVMDCSEIERSFSAHFASTTGRPALPPRLVAGLLYLQHAYDCSDEIAVNTWVENPYCQFCTGETYLQI
jgi:hypothetical protein